MLREEQEAVLADQRPEGRPARFEVWQQIPQRAGIQHGARQHVRPAIAGLLEHGDGDGLATVRFPQACQMERG